MVVRAKVAAATAVEAAEGLAAATAVEAAEGLAAATARDRARRSMSERLRPRTGPISLRHSSGDEYSCHRSLHCCILNYHCNSKCCTSPQQSTRPRCTRHEL